MDPHKQTRGLLLGAWVDAHGGATKCLVAAGYDQGSKEFRAREAHLSASRKAGMGHVAALRYEREFESQGMAPGALTNNLEEGPGGAPSFLRTTSPDPGALRGVGDSVDQGDSFEVPVLRNGASMGGGEEQTDEDSVSGLRLLPNWVHANLRNCKPEALRFIHGHGDSMTPTYNSGDILLVDTDTKDVKVDGVYVLQAHGRLFIKRVRQRMDGQFEISSDNPAHKTVDTLSGTEQVVVKGRVVWAWNGRKV
jgi:hypothetical protein